MWGRIALLLSVLWCLCFHCRLGSHQRCHRDMAPVISCSGMSLLLSRPQTNTTNTTNTTTTTTTTTGSDGFAMSFVVCVTNYG